MTVLELWRYPVKSLRGERLSEARITGDGVAGDRLVHVRTGNGKVATSRHHPRLLGLDGAFDDDGTVLIDGRPWSAPESLAAVRAAVGPDATLHEFTAPDVGQRHDVLPLTVLTDGMAQALGYDHRRFRPNVYLGGVDGLAERGWPGSALRIGTALVGVKKARERCVMTTFDPDTLDRDPTVLRRIVREFDKRVALDCWVIRGGTVAVGDRAEVVELPIGASVPAGNATRPPKGRIRLHAPPRRPPHDPYCER